MLLLKQELLYFFISFIAIYTFEEALIKKDQAKKKFALRKHGKPSHPNSKNEVTGFSNVRQVCMDVCRPPYYAQEYQESYNHPQYNQYYPSDTYGYGDPYGGYNNPQYYPQNGYGGYYSGCYRNMFKKKFDIDPGTQKPRVYSYKKFQKRIFKNPRKNRNYGYYYQDYLNCQLICYPSLVTQSVASTVSTTKAKVSVSTKPTKRTTTTESTESSSPSEEQSEATVLPPLKPETTLKPPANNTTIAGTKSTELTSGQPQEIISQSAPLKPTGQKLKFG